MKTYTFDELAELHVGDTCYESGQYGTIHFELITPPAITYDESLESKKISFDGVDLDSDRVITYVFTERLMHYSPTIYDFPAYISTN